MPQNFVTSGHPAVKRGGDCRNDNKLFVSISKSSINEKKKLFLTFLFNPF
jgi:hypothetical protein